MLALSAVSISFGIARLLERNTLGKWTTSADPITWLVIGFALADATPGLLFLTCALAQQ